MHLKSTIFWDIIYLGMIFYCKDQYSWLLPFWSVICLKICAHTMCFIPHVHVCADVEFSGTWPCMYHLVTGWVIVPSQTKVTVFLFPASFVRKCQWYDAWHHWPLHRWQVPFCFTSTVHEIYENIYFFMIFWVKLIWSLASFEGMKLRLTRKSYASSYKPCCWYFTWFSLISFHAFQSTVYFR
jgi:hypothetical protein